MVMVEHPMTGYSDALVEEDWSAPLIFATKKGAEKKARRMRKRFADKGWRYEVVKVKPRP